MNYSIIDKELTHWAVLKGYTVQTQYRDDEVRAFEIWSPDHQQKIQLGVGDLTQNEVELIVFDGKRKRKKLRGSVERITELLDEGEALARSWISGDSS